MIYSAKIINPNNTGGEVVIDKFELRKKSQYTSVDTLKAELCESFSDYVDGYDTNFGFIVPGHGMKGKQEKLDTNEELKNMYILHQKKKRISFWLKCRPKSKKRASPDCETSQSKRQNSLVGIMCEVDEIVTKLKEKHGTEKIYTCSTKLLGPHDKYPQA